MTIYNTSVLIALVLLFFTFYALAKRKLDFRYVIFWCVLSLLLIIISVNVNILEGIASVLGIYYAPSALFAAALVFILAFIFYITVFISDITKRIIRLTQEVGLLKSKLEELGGKEEEK